MKKIRRFQLVFVKIYRLLKYPTQLSYYLPSYSVEEKDPCRRENLLVKKIISENLKHFINSTVCVEESWINPLEKNND